MTDSVFIDTNVLVYAFLDNDKARHDMAVQLLSEMMGKEVFISTQVMSEIYSALSKNGIGHEAISNYLFDLEEDFNVRAVTPDTIRDCLLLKKKYFYSYWDSLILASSLESGCSVVYSEDMQHRQVIEQSLTIMNPFF
uniref:Predicted nucleic acid-binding protein, contains PIN domain n=1 Tax=Candidatus Kentrum sp. FW TaxID=2126338 RepID=A0A450TIG7_9GAMM|nr:MAG: Predicted nucleic acid-binding protein, contains PIN domain [Candidatus Kentron sp. FW]VFJ67067.1 MAG: Predicted nucleic acid-binding protein, contains PIN domain [Candidatus Kentron sp. FW]